MLVRSYFPDAEIVVLADSGTGVARGASDPDWVRRLLDEIGAIGFVPEDCVDCLGDGHVTRMMDWWFGRDPNVRIGVFSSWYDSIIGDVFLRLPPAEFRDALGEATGALHGAWPDRYRRFLIDGRMHTSLLGDPTGIIGADLTGVELPPDALTLLTDLEIGQLEDTTAEGVRYADWIGGLLDGDLEVWVDVVEAAGPVPGEE